MKNNSKLRKLKKKNNNTFIEDIDIEINKNEIIDKLLRKEESHYLFKSLKSFDYKECDILYKTFFLEYTYQDLIKESNLEFIIFSI